MDQQTKISIDRTIPLPKSGAGRNGLSKYPWAEMSIGDSFLFPAGTTRAAAYANANSAQKRIGFKFSVRMVADGFRCWRIA